MELLFIKKDFYEEKMSYKFSLSILVIHYCLTHDKKELKIYGLHSEL